MLVEHFIGRMKRLHGKPVTGLSQEALALLMFHNYPGNIRELENIIEHASVLCPAGEIGLSCLPESLQVAASQPLPQRGMQAALRATETQVILDALARNHYHRLAAARELKMHKSTLYRKIKSMGLHLPEMDGRSNPKPSR